MADLPTIEVNSLGKRFLIKRGEGPRTHTLREALSLGLSRFFGLAPPPSETDFWALRNVNFSVNPGESVGLIGKNGAGKSTLLRILSRITLPTEGSVTIRGRCASILDIGTGFHPELTGRENVFLNGAMMGMARSEISRKFDEIVDFAEVVDFLDLPIKRYSNGMYLRLAFAIASQLEPEIFLIDEVLAVGDRGFRDKCLERLASLRKNGTTLLFISHDFALLRRFCDRLLLIRGGTVHSDSKDIEGLLAQV